MNSIQHWVQVPKIDAIRDTQISCGEEGSWPEYVYGLEPPNYPMPAIPLAVKYDYVGCLNIDDVSDPDDPIIVYGWDSWNETNF